MNSLLYFLAGLILGLLAWHYSTKKAKIETNELSDQKIRLQQEKEIVVDFMHNFAVAIGEGVVRQDLESQSMFRNLLTTQE